ncbi:MAG: ABC transporter permease [Nitrospirae bacterium]|nr:ABC transporter permease [Nitrospirota bacterium]
MIPSAYTFRFALSSLYKEKWINLLSALTIATGLILMTMVFSILYNINLATQRLPDRFSITVFLDEGIDEEKTKGIIQTIKGNNSVKDLKYISKDDALKELKTLTKDSAYILDGVEENPLPPSVVITLKRELVSEASVKNLSSELMKVQGIAEVYYGEKFLSSIQAIKGGAEKISLLILIALSAGVIFVCYSTVKILFYRKKEEIETLQLLGATKGFIRAPFIIEGGAIGAVAGLTALAGILMLKYFITLKLSESFPALQSMSVPVETVFYVPLTGLLIGLVGAVIALGRIRF